MPRPKLIDVSTAQALAREYHVILSRPTIIKYVQKKKLGHQIGGKGGKWVINQEKFRRFIRGENEQTNQTEEEAPAIDQLSGGEDTGQDQKQEEEQGEEDGGGTADTSPNPVLTL